MEILGRQRADVGRDELKTVANELFGGIVHLALFRGGNLVESGAMAAVFAIFDLGEVDIICFYRDEVDFVGLSFEVLGYDKVT